MTVFVAVCRACGHALFPSRLLCPRCGGDAWDSVAATDGVVMEATSMQHRVAAPVHLASVRTDLGVVVLARMERAVAIGDRVALRQQDGAVVGQAR
jgi:uncharacterized OB-fold protein